MRCMIRNVTGFELELHFYLAVTVHSQEFEELKLLWNQKIKLSKMMLACKNQENFLSLYKGI